MAEDEDDDGGKDRLFRVRGTLLLLTVVLLAHQFLGVTIEKSVESQGLHFEFEKPERLFLAVWIVWGWSLVCYLQHLYTLRVFSKYPRDRQAETYKAMCDRWVSDEATRRVRSSFHRQVAKANRIDMALQKQYRGLIDKTPAMALEFSLLWKHEPDDPRAVNLLVDAEAPDGWFIVHSGDGLARDGSRVRSGTVWVPLQLVQSSRRNVLAALWVCVATTFVTDYLAPVAIGLLPPAIACEQYIAARVERHPTPAPKKGGAPPTSRFRVPF